MVLEGKTNQTVTLYVYRTVLKDSLPTPQWKNEIWKDGIARIDEMLNGFINWNITETKQDIGTDITSHVWAMNEVQLFLYKKLGWVYRQISPM
ncbi:MAG TPA: hypothetical protein PK191_03370 [Niabella sp.]|nr:hypothetical protein [Niabella sp.]HOZ95435.1 hypothetical protein [Niabella sp.]HQW14325.1 hypothetical protein [Niabella sp.]HQX18396.1 hypothetical protein [Niabella sp.]HQX40112.1 hypothetical protein [Niabella sp.]